MRATTVTLALVASVSAYAAGDLTPREKIEVTYECLQEIRPKLTDDEELLFCICVASKVTSTEKIYLRKDSWARSQGLIPESSESLDRKIAACSLDVFVRREILRRREDAR